MSQLAEAYSVLECVSRIRKQLELAGAAEIRFERTGETTDAAAWLMDVRGKRIAFRMPSRAARIHTHLLRGAKGRMTPQRQETLMAKAELMAWQHLCWWVESQVVMIIAGMMEPAEPFLPFVVVPGSNGSFFDIFAANEAAGRSI